MDRKPRVFARALALSLVVAATGESASRFERARELVLEEMASGDLPAFVVAVARGDELLWEEAFGRATPRTAFSLASITKPLTATGLMVLVERGEIELERPVNVYLGDAPLRARVGRADEASVLRVASHTAGLPLHHHFFPFSQARRPPPLAETLGRYGNLFTEPGESFQYSNLGYGVLEHAIERVGKRSYATFMEEEVFRPLGMVDAAVVLSPDAPELRDRRLAERFEDGRALPFYDFDHRGASAAYASVRDLVRFGRFHVGSLELDGDPILSRRSIAKMQEPEARMPGGWRYGIGWMIFENRWGERVVEHGGDMPGVSTTLYLVPDRRIVFVALASARTDLHDRVREAVLEELLGGFELRARRRRVSSSGGGASRAREREIPEDFLGVWTGEIETHRGGVSLTLTVTSSEIRGRLGSAPETDLVGVSFDGDRMTALMRGDLGAEELELQDAMLRFAWTRRGDRLSGAATLLATDTEGFPLALSHWAELGRR